MTHAYAKQTGGGSASRSVMCSLCGYFDSGPKARRWHDCKTVAVPSCGPGCQLKRSLAWWGIRDDGKCGCTEFAAQMDRWGPRECWRRIEEIVEHLRGAAAAKGLPFIATAARMLVARAIEAAEEEHAHGQAKASDSSSPDR